MRAFAIASMIQATRVAACYDDSANATTTVAAPLTCDEAKTAVDKAAQTMGKKVETPAASHSFLQTTDYATCAKSGNKAYKYAHVSQEITPGQAAALAALVLHEPLCNKNDVKVAREAYEEAQAAAIKACCTKAELAKHSHDHCVWTVRGSSSDGSQDQQGKGGDFCTLYTCWKAGKAVTKEGNHVGTTDAPGTFSGSNVGSFLQKPEECGAKGQVPSDDLLAEPIVKAVASVCGTAA